MSRLKRYFSLYPIPLKLLVGVLFIYLILLGYPEGILKIISNIAFGIVVIGLMDLETIFNNWRWFKTGAYDDIPKYRLSRSEKILRKARLSKQKPLFVSVNDKYYYIDDNFEYNNVTNGK